jgi:hypothetical protein
MKMKKILLVLFVLTFAVGSASAGSYIGMFNSEIDGDHTDADGRVTVAAANDVYTVYIMVNADWDVGFNAWQLKMDKHSSDYLLATTYVDPTALAINSPFDYQGWVVANPSSCWHGWNLVCTLTMGYAGEGAHEITMEPYNLTPYPECLSCANERMPLSVIGPFGVNMDIIPTNESSWGAVKSMYR